MARPEHARLAWIRDTKHLRTFHAREALLPELEATGQCQVVRPPGPIGFDAHDALTDPTPG